MGTAYKYPKCTDCVHAHMDKNGNHDCGFMDCVSEQDKEYPDETTFESYLSCYDCLQKYVSAERCIAELEKENEEMKKGLGCETCQIHLEFVKLNQEITELKEQNKKLLESCEDATMMYEDLCKAKEIIKELLDFDFLPEVEIKKQAEQFIKDSEVEK